MKFNIMTVAVIAMVVASVPTILTAGGTKDVTKNSVDIVDDSSALNERVEELNSPFNQCMRAAGQRFLCDPEFFGAPVDPGQQFLKLNISVPDYEGRAHEEEHRHGGIGKGKKGKADPADKLRQISSEIGSED